MSSASITSLLDAAPHAGGAGTALFELRAGPFVGGELRVLELKGREALSKPFTFEVMFTSDAPPWELEAGLVGQSATLVLQAPGHPSRVVHGITAWLRAENVWKGENATRRYTVRLVPSVWKLGKRINTRIFQDQAVSDVITTLMTEAGLSVRFDLSRPLPRKNYCVQYDESDLAFITRLLAEAACYFYFEPPVGILEQLGLGGLGAAAAGVAGVAGAVGLGAPGAAMGALGLVETMVVSDQASFYPAIPDGAADEVIERVAGAVGNSVVSNLAAAAPTLVHRDPSGMVIDPETTVTRMNFRRALRSNAVTLRDYLYEKPLFDARVTTTTGNVAAAAGTLGTAALNDVGAALRGGSANLGASALELLTAVPTDLEKREVYRHQSDFFELDAKDPNAQLELEQHRRKAWQAEGEGMCRRMASGYKFALAAHEDDRLNRVWVVTSVRHRGITGEWASAQGQRSREHEQVRQYTNTFTCAPAELTIRPRRPPPRAVQVADTAVVVGPEGKEVYTDSVGRIKVQFHWDRVGALNEHSSCWIRVLHAWSGTSWGTQFIPRIGMEVLVLYHQGDPDKPVVIGCLPNAVTPQPFPLPDDATRSGLRTNTLPGGGGHNELSFEDRRGGEQILLRAQRNFDEQVLVDHTVEVGRDERETVSGSRTETVKGNDTLTVGGDRSDNVAGDRTEGVRGQRVLRVEGNAKDTVDGLEQRSVGGSAYLTARGNYVVTVTGTSATVVGSREEPAESHTAVWGKSALFSSDELRIQSEKTIVLECGESRITMTPDGVTIAAKAITLDGHESTSIFGKKPVMHFTDVVTLASDKITLTSQGASLALDSNATLLGTAVKLGKGSSASTQTRDPIKGETKPFLLQLCDAAFTPYANKPYDIMVAGVELKGSTDGQGNVHEQVPKDATVADVTLWLKPPPTGVHLRWQVLIDETLPPPSDVRGAQIRLRNLGYYVGEPDGVATEGLADAIRAFQRDQNLPNDGVLGGATLGKLTQAHGL